MFVPVIDICTGHHGSVGRIHMWRTCILFQNTVQFTQSYACLCMHNKFERYLYSETNPGLPKHTEDT